VSLAPSAVSNSVLFNIVFLTQYSLNRAAYSVVGGSVVTGNYTKVTNKVVGLEGVHNIRSVLFTSVTIVELW